MRDMIVCDCYDPMSELLYIADSAYDTDGHMVFRGYMTCHMPAHEMSSLLGHGENPVEYALGCFPAPGSGAPDRMGFIPRDEAAELDLKDCVPLGNSQRLY